MKTETAVSPFVLAIVGTTKDVATARRAQGLREDPVAVEKKPKGNIEAIKDIQEQFEVEVEGGGTSRQQLQPSGQI